MYGNCSAAGACGCGRAYLRFDSRPPVGDPGVHAWDCVSVPVFTRPWRRQITRATVTACLKIPSHGLTQRNMCKGSTNLCCPGHSGKGRHASMDWNLRFTRRAHYLGYQMVAVCHLPGVVGRATRYEGKGGTREGSGNSVDGRSPSLLFLTRPGRASQELPCCPRCNPPSGTPTFRHSGLSGCVCSRLAPSRRVGNTISRRCTAPQKRAPLFFFL